MFAKETYMQRRALLKKNLGSGVLLFLGNDECGLNYEDNTFRYRQDSTFLYYFGLSCAGLSAIIDIDEDKEIIFGDELSIDAIVWMGSQPTLHEKCERVGVKNLMPSADIVSYLHQCVQKGKAIHYLPPYRPEHKLKLMDWLGIPPAHQEGSVPFIRAVIAQRNYKSAEEIVEIEKACDVTADMHITAMKVLRPGMYEYEVVAEMNRVAESNNCQLSFATIATINGQTLHNHYHGNKVKPGDLFLIDAGAEVESGYAGDMSSTIPADKKFTTRQREVYEIQNAMHLESVKALRPGIPYMDVYELSARIMVDGMKTDPGTSLLLLFIVKSFLKDFQNFFFFHWFDQISERMDTKRILPKIFISCHINDLCLFIPNSDFSGSINPRNSFHVNVQKDHIIKNIRFQECLSAFKIRDAKNRFQLFEICLHLFSHCRLIITYRNFFHFLFIPLPIIFLA